MTRLSAIPAGAVALTLALAAALPAPAAAAPVSAASVATDRGCYRPGQPVGLTLAGMPVGALIDLRTADDYIDSVTVDDAGAFQGTFAAPDPGRSAATIDLIAGSSLAIYAQTSFMVAPLGVSMRPARAVSSRTVTFRATGFVEGGTLYLHVVRTISDTVHRVVATLRLGALGGPCGTLTRKLTQLPLKRPKPGTYDLQFDLSPTYARRQGTYVERSTYVVRKR